MLRCVRPRQLLAFYAEQTISRSHGKQTSRLVSLPSQFFERLVLVRHLHCGKTWRESAPSPSTGSEPASGTDSEPALETEVRRALGALDNRDYPGRGELSVHFILLF